MKQSIGVAFNFKLKTDQDRQVFYMFFSLLCNIGVLIVELIFGIMTQSIWLFANAGFHFVIGLARIISIRDYIKMRYEKNQTKKQEIGYRNYITNGILLILLGAIYFIISIYMMFQDTTNDLLKGEIIVISVAAMAFWCLGIAIFEIIKYKRMKDPIINAIKTTNNANALTMIVLTQTVLLAEYGTDVDNIALFNGGTGMAMSLIIIYLGIYMVKGRKTLKG